MSRGWGQIKGFGYGRAVVRSCLRWRAGLLLPLAALIASIGPRLASGNPPPAPTMAISTTSLNFGSVPYGSNPANQTFQVWNSGVGTLNYEISHNAPFVIVCNPSSGNSTGSTDKDTITVSLNASFLTPGTKNYTITISDDYATNGPLTIAVTVTIQTPSIAVSTTSLNFGSVGVGSNPANQTFQVWSAGGGKINYSISHNWAFVMACSPTSGDSVGTGDKDTITVSLNTSNLTPGTYTKQITVSDSNASNSPRTISVTVTVDPPSIALNKTSIDFGTVAYGTTPASQTFQVWSAVGGLIDFDIDHNWTFVLTVSPNSGTSTGSGDKKTITVGINPSFPPLPGSYTRQITVTDPNASNSPRTITVTMTVQSPVIAVSPTTMHLGQFLVGTTVPSQTFQVWSASGGKINYSISDNSFWVACSPTSGDSTGSTDKDTINVTFPNTSSLAVGTYPFEISITDANASNSPLKIQGSFIIATNPTIALSETTINRTIWEFVDAPSEPITVSNSGGFTLSYSINSSESWVFASPSTGTSTGPAQNHNVIFDTDSLTPGNHSAILTVSDPNATNDPRTIQVNVTVNDRPSIAASPSTLSPTVWENQDAEPQTFTLSNSASATLNYSISESVGWISSVSPLSGSLTDTQQQVTTVNYSTSSLAPGQYSGEIRIDDPLADNSPLLIPVNLTVRDRPRIGLSPTSLSMAMPVDQIDSSQTFEVWNDDPGESMLFSISDTETWLSVSPTGGYSSGEHHTITVTYNTNGLSPGWHYGTIYVAGSPAENTPWPMSVSLLVVDAPELVSVKPECDYDMELTMNVDANYTDLEILRREEPSGDWIVPPGGTFSGSFPTSWIDTSTTHTQTYSYQIRATRPSVPWQYSDTLTTTTYQPIEIAGFTVNRSASDDYTEVSWSSITGSNIERLEIYRNGELVPPADGSLGCLLDAEGNLLEGPNLPLGATLCDDFGGGDLTPPEAPGAGSVDPPAGGIAGPSIAINWTTPTDQGSDHEYYLKVVDGVCGNDVQTGAQSVSIPGGLAGYELALSTRADPSTLDVGDKFFTAGVAATSFEFTNDQMGNGLNYVHLRSIDNAGNVSSWVTFGPWSVDKRAPEPPLLVEASGIQIDRSSIFWGGPIRKIGATFDLTGSYPVSATADSDTTVTLRLYAKLAPPQTGQPFEIPLPAGSEILVRPAANQSVQFVIEGISSSLIPEFTPHVLYATVTDQAYAANVSLNSNTLRVMADRSPPLFFGLASAIPAREGPGVAQNRVDLRWQMGFAPGVLFEDTVKIYEVYRSSTLPIDLQTDLFDTRQLTVEEYNASPPPGNWIEASYDLADRTNNSYWAVRSIDLLGNATSLGAVHTVYGDSATSLTFSGANIVLDDPEWGDLAVDFDVAVSFGFSPLSGSTSGSEMFFWSGDVIPVSGVSNTWAPFSGVIDPVTLAMTGTRTRRVNVQFRDEFDHYSFPLMAEVAFDEPSVLRRLDLVDAATNGPLPDRLGSGQQVVARLLTYNQFDEPMAVDPGEFVISFSDPSVLSYQLIDAGTGYLDYALTGQKLGITRFEIAHQTLAYYVSHLFEVDVPGLVASIDLEGPERIRAGQTVVFKATGYDAAGNVAPLSPIWFTDSLGSINTFGVLRTISVANELTGIVRITDETTSVFAQKSATLDGRAPIVLSLELDPPAESDGIILDSNTVLSVRIPDSAPEWEESLAAQYELLIDDRPFAKAFQESSDDGELVFEGVFNPAQWRRGFHEFKIISTDSLGNTNSDDPWTTTGLRTTSGPLVASPIDWLLEHQNLFADRPSERGTWWISAGRNPSSNPDDASDLISAAVLEINHSVATLLRHDFDYSSGSTNLSTSETDAQGLPIPGTARVVTVREALEASLSFLATVLLDEQIADLETQLLAAEAINQSLGRGLSIRYVDMQSGIETPLAEADLNLLIEAILLEALSRGSRGGYAATDDKSASRMATLLALLLHADFDGAPDIPFYDADAGGGTSIYQYFNLRVDPDGLGGLVSAPDSRGGWSLNQWDYWNEGRSVFVTAETVRALNRFKNAYGDSVELVSLQDRAETLLLDRVVPFGFEPPELGFGDPLPLFDIAPTSATIVSTAATLIALHESNRLDPNTLREGVRFLRRAQLEDKSWNSRALDTALAMRLLRSDLEFGQTLAFGPHPSGTGYTATVEIRNIGVEPARNFSVTVHGEHPGEATSAERDASRLGASPLIPEIQPDQTLSVTTFISQLRSPLFLMADGKDTVAELDETNNVLVMDPARSPDLAFSPSGLRFGAFPVEGFQKGKPILHGEDWGVEMTVLNLGAGPLLAGQARVELYLGNLTQPSFNSIKLAQPSGGWPELPALQPGESTTILVFIPGDSADFPQHGTYPISAKIETVNVAEPTTLNNVTVGHARLYDVIDPSGRPDLVLRGPQFVQIDPFAPQAGEPFTARVLLMNEGDVSVVDPVLEMWVDNGSPRRKRLTGTLPAKSWIVAEFQLALDAPGAYLRFVADPDNAIPEISEMNNEVIRPVGVSAPGLYDLAVGMRQGDIQLVRLAGNWAIQVVVRNVGGSFYRPGLDHPEHVLTFAQAGSALPTASLVLNQPLDPGQSQVMTFSAETLSSLPEDQPNILEFTLTPHVDASPINDRAVAEVYLDGWNQGDNLIARDLEPTPLIGVIESAEETHFEVDFRFVVENESLSVMQDVTVDLYDATRARVLWSTTLDLIAPQSSLTMTVKNVPLDPGAHEICVRIDPFGSIFEENRNDNQICAGVSIRDEAVRPLPDLFFTEEPIRTLRSGDQLIVFAEIANDSPDTAEAPAAAGPFTINATLDSGSGPVEVSTVALSGLAPRARREVVLVMTQPAQGGTLTLMADSAGSPPSHEVEESNEANNTKSLEYIEIPPPDAFAGVARLGELLVHWNDSASLGTPGFLAAEDLAGYRLTRLLEGSVQTQRFVSPPPDPNGPPDYAVTDRDAIPDQVYTYRIVTIANSGLESPPLEIDVKAGERPTLDIYYPVGSELPLDPLIIPAVGAETYQIEVRVTAKDATSVDLFFNGAPTELTDPVDGVFTRLITLDVNQHLGNNVFFAQPKLSADPVIYGPMTQAKTVILRTGVDLTGTRSELLVFRKSPGQTDWQLMDMKMINVQPAGTRFIFAQLLHNVESLDAPAFDVQFTIGNDFFADVVYTAPITNGLSGGATGVALSQPFETPLSQIYERPTGTLITEIEVLIDFENDVLETFEDNNRVFAVPTQCKTDADIMIVLDRSGSMGSKDGGTENRLQIAKREILKLVGQFPGSEFFLTHPEHRVGLVSFDHKSLPVLDTAFVSHFGIKLDRPENFPTSLNGIRVSGGTSVLTGLEQARLHFLNLPDPNHFYFPSDAWNLNPTMVREGATPAILLVDDGTQTNAADVAKAAQFKREMLAEPIGEIPKVFNVHIGPSASNWLSSNQAMYMRHLTSTIDVTVTEDSLSDDWNSFRIVPYGAEYKAPVAILGSNEEIWDDSYPDYHFLNSGFVLELFGIPLSGPFRYNYLMGATQILTHKDNIKNSNVPEGRFTVDKPSMVVVLFPNGATPPDWLNPAESDWRVWNQYNRYGFTEQLELVPIREGTSVDPPAPTKLYKPYVLHLSGGSDNTFTLGTGDGKFYTAFVIGDPSQAPEDKTQGIYPTDPKWDPTVHDPYIRLVQINPLTGEDMSVGEGFRFFFDGICPPVNDFEDEINLAASFFDPDAPEHGYGDLGFPEGAPAIGETGRIVGKMFNHGGLLADDPQYRLTVESPLGNELDVITEWTMPPNLPHKLFTSDPYLPSEMGVLVEADWTHPYYPGYDDIYLVLRVKDLSGPDADPLNDMAFVQLDNRPVSGNYPDLRWASSWTAEREPQPWPGTSEMMVPLRWGKDSTVAFDLEIETYNGYVSDVDSQLTAQVVGVGGTTSVGHLEVFESPLPTSPAGAPLTNLALLGPDLPGVWPARTPFRFVLHFDQSAVTQFNELAGNDGIQAGTILPDLQLNPNLEDEDSSVERLMEDPPLLSGGNIFDTPIVLAVQFHNVAVSNFQVAGRVGEKVLLTVDVTREMTPAIERYPFNDVRIALFDGDHTVPDEPLGLINQTVVHFPEDETEQTQTLEFLWPPDERDSVTLSIIADAGAPDLHEHPIYGRNDNAAKLVFTIPGRLNLRADDFVALIDEQPVTEIERGQTASLRLTADYTGGADVPAEQSYKVKFWSGYPAERDAATVLEEFYTTGHPLGVLFPTTAPDLLPTAGLYGTHTLYAEIDPRDHLAMAAPSEDRPSTMPLIASELWPDDPFQVEVARAGEAPELWKVTVSVADPDDFTQRTPLAEWTSDATTVTLMAAAPQPGPILVEFEAVDNGDPGQETLPPFEFGDLVRILIPVAYDLDTTPTLSASNLAVPLPPTGPYVPARAVAFWVADDGSSYFANAHHLHSDFNFGGGAEAVVTLDPQRAMADPTGLIEESDEADNLINLQVAILDPTTLDLGLQAFALFDDEGEPLGPTEEYPIGSTAHLRIPVINLKRPHSLNLLLQARLGDAQGEILGRRRIDPEGGWETGETRLVDLDLTTGQFSDDVTVYLELVVADDDPTNNSVSGNLPLFGTLEFTIADPLPATISSGGQVSFTLDAESIPGFSGEIDLWLTDDGPGVLRIPVNDPALDGIDLVAGPVSVPMTWTDPGLTPGAYRFVGDLVDSSSGSVRASAVSNLFQIQQPVTLIVDVEPERFLYEFGEAVRLDVLVEVPLLYAALPGDVDLEVIVSDQRGNLIESFAEDIAGLPPGSERAFVYFVSDLDEENYEVVASAVHSAQPPANAEDVAAFVVGGASDAPVEWIQVVAADGVTPLVYANDTAATIGLKNLGAAQLGVLDHVFLSNARKPLELTNLIVNGDLTQPVGGGSIPHHWFGAQRTELGGSGSGEWALQLGSPAAVSNASLPEAGENRSESIRVEPRRDYVLAFDTLLPDGAATTSLSVSIHQYRMDGAAIEPALEFAVDRAAFDPAAVMRSEFSFRSTLATRYIDVIFEQDDGFDPILIRNIRLHPGTVAAAYVSSADANLNLVRNPNFSVDDGTDFTTISPALLQFADAQKENGIPDAWSLTGGGSLLVDLADSALPAEASALGFDRVIELQNTGLSPVLSQSYLPAPSGALQYAIWSKGNGRLSIGQFDVNLNAVGSPIEINLTSADWSKSSGALGLDATTAYISVSIDSIPGGQSLRVASVAAGSADDLSSAWQGWAGMPPGPAAWNLESTAPDGPRSVHGRYLTRFGVISEAPIHAMSRDANRDGVVDRSIDLGSGPVPVMNLSALTLDGASTASLSASELLNLTDGSALSGYATSAGLDALTLDAVSPIAVYINNLRLEADVLTTATLRVSGSIGDDLYFTVHDAPLGQGDYDELVPIGAAFDRWRIELVADDPTLGLAVNINELELRGPMEFGTATVVLDRTPPVIEPDPIVPDPSNLSTVRLTGVLSDNLSGVASLAYRIPAISSDWSPVANYQAGSSSFDFEIANAPEGLTTIELRAADRAANESQAGLQVLLDYTPPLLALDEPAPDPTGNPALDFAGSVSDPGGSGVAQVEMRLNADSWETAQHDSQSETFSWSKTATADGLYQVHARATDFAGNVSIDSKDVMVDTTPPVLVLNEYLPDPTSQSSLGYTGSAHDGEGSGVALVQLRLDGGAWTDADAFDPQTTLFSHAVAVGSDGERVVWARAVDVVGNESITSDTVTVDTTPPLIVLNEYLPDPTANAAPLYTGTATSEGAPIVSVQISVDGGAWSDVAAYNPLTGAFSHQVALIGDGLHQITARAIDLAGNEAADSDLLTLDTVGPTLVFDAPTSGTWHNEPVTVLWSTEATDLATSYGLGLVTALESDDTTTFTIASGDFVFDEGRYDILAWGEDFLGNAGPIAELQFGVDLTSPVQSLVPVGLLSSATVLREGEAHDWHGSGIAQVESRLDGGPWTPANSVVAAPSPEWPTRVQYTLLLDGLTSQTHSLEVRVRDLAGNHSIPTTDTMQLDLFAPQIVINSPEPNETFDGESASTILIEARVTDDVSGVAPGTVQYLIDIDGEEWAPMTLISGDAWDGIYQASRETWELYDGPAVLRIRAADMAANDENTSPTDANEAAVPILIDTDYPPQAPTGLVASYISFTEVEVHWNKNEEPDLDYYRLYRRVNDGQPMLETDLRTDFLPDTPNGLSYNVQIDPVNNTAPYYWDYAMRAVDLAGNISLWSEQISVPPPGTPDDLIAIGSDQKIDLTWKPIFEGFVKGYQVYRAQSADLPTSNSFTLLTEVLGQAAASYTDTNVVNGQAYWYFVKAFDGAHNTSLKSNIARGIPDASRTSEETVLVRFEDQARHQYIDWDFNDVGAEITTKQYLTPDDKVTSITITAVLWYHDASDNYDMLTRLSGFVGTGTYSGTVYQKNGTVDRVIAPHVYDPLSTDLLTKNIPLFEGIGTGNGDKIDYRVEITLVVDDPASNPRVSFDRAPYDTWMSVIGDTTEYHIFDPITGEYANDNVLILGDPDLNGIYLTSGLVIRKRDWTQPFNGKKIWRVYPDFVDYAKTYRTLDIQNLNWYDNGPYNPN